MNNYRLMARALGVILRVLFHAEHGSFILRSDHRTLLYSS